jgi:putative chitinase
MIMREELAALAVDPDIWLRPLNDAMELHEIDNVDRIASFLAQCAHESNGFRRLDENLNYSAAALLKTWPTHFNAEQAEEYSHEPERIANRAYANRMGNGDEESGDGWRFKGRGIIQITGRNMYRRCGGMLGVNVEEHPELLVQPLYAALSAAWYWQTNGCNELADAQNYAAITRKINGGLTGLEDRMVWLDKTKAALA